MSSALFEKVAVNIYESKLRELVKVNSELGRLYNLLYPSVDCLECNFTVEELVDAAVWYYIQHLKASCELTESLLSESSVV